MIAKSCIHLLFLVLSVRITSSISVISDVFIYNREPRGLDTLILDKPGESHKTECIIWPPLRSLTIIADLTTVICYTEHSRSVCIK